MAVKFLIKTLGCKVNQYDSLALKRKLLALGFEIGEDQSEIVVVNTCAVTKKAILKDRRMFGALRAKHPKAKFVLMGCFAQTYPEQAEQFKPDLAWGVGNLGELAKKICNLAGVEVVVGNWNESEIEGPKTGERSRYFLKIQDGCEQFCSYCNIPFARGKLASRPEQEVFAEIKKAISAGFGEIVLCGVHLGLYGREKKSRARDLATLLREILKIEGLGRIRLSSIEVNDISQEILELMSKSGKICPHLHIPLQAGSDKILKAMNRPYDTKYFEDVVLRCRQSMPDIAITTDVIVGFPGESEDDFSLTMEFCKKIGFAKMHVFPFSAHEKTPAAKMENKVALAQIKQRAKKLRQVGEAMEKEYVKNFLDKEIEIVVEKKEGDFFKGKESHYFDAKIVSEQGNCRIGTLRKGISR